MKEKIEKLIAHEKSARLIGNTDEANAFQQKIQELKNKRAQVESAANKQQRWKCTCGYELVLNADDSSSAGTQVLIDIMLSSHRRPGHQLNLTS